MKKITFIFAVAILALSCKEKTQEPSTPVTEEVTTVVKKEYPEAISAVFKAHGGIDSWNDMNYLSYTMGDQRHTIDLKSRKTLIQTDKYTLGFDGEKVWLAQDSLHFQPQRARFMHNLMFYFYAMPFVLGDDGITYSDAPALEFEGVSYPGTKISFGSGVGDAPDDEYILYRNPENNQMAWLAYTVTYGKNEKSTNFSYIKYDQWADVGGLQLPSIIQWYQMEDGVPIKKAGERVFTDAVVSKNAPDASQFEKPEGAEFAE